MPTCVMFTANQRPRNNIGVENEHNVLSLKMKFLYKLINSHSQIGDEPDYGVVHDLAFLILDIEEACH